MVLARRYPFIVTLRDYSLKVAGVEFRVGDLARDEAIARLALKRFRAYMEGAEYEPERGSTVDDEVFSFHLAVALAAALGPTALRRLAEAEASRARNTLRLEDEATLLEIAAGLGVSVSRSSLSIPWQVDPKGGVRRRILTYRVHVSDYLRVHGASDREDALTNAFLLGGWVYLDRQGLEDLIYEAVKARVESLAGQVDPSELPEGLLSKARAALEEALDKGSRRLTELDPKAFPPCIQAIIEKASRAGVGSLSDPEGYMLATFLAYTRIDSGTLQSMLGVPEDAARAVASLARYARLKGFRPLKCQAAKAVGVCRWDCRGPTPLSEYRSRLAIRTPAAGGGGG